MALLALFSPVAAFAADRNVNLDGVQLCVPARYLPPPPPFWVGLSEGESDNANPQLHFRIEAEALRKAIPAYKPDTNLVRGNRLFTAKEVVVSTVSAMSGRSQAEQRIAGLVGSGEAVFESSPVPAGLIKVSHDASGFHWSLVRSSEVPKPLTTESLRNWIAAFCGKGIDERYACHVQRIVGPLAYSVSIPDLNMENMEDIARFIEGLLRSWSGTCDE